jgi:TrmH family RNA methyltransferase
MTRHTEVITSRKNPVAQHARAVREGREEGLVFVEGVRLLEEAVGASLKFETVLYAESAGQDERAALLLKRLRRLCERVSPVSESVLESVSDVKSSQGVVALARRPSTGREVIETPNAVPLVVIMHRVNNPSNAGAMLRVAEAAGATAAVATRGSTDLFSPKSLRGSMGSAFRLPLWTGARLDEALSCCRERGIRTVASSVRAASTHTEIDWTVPRAVVVGPEAGGLSVEEAADADEHLRIPMRETVESLNVAVALAVVLYEAARQRGFRQHT